MTSPSIADHITDRPPRSIAELAVSVQPMLSGPRSFKVWLRAGQEARSAAKQYDEAGDIENAFRESAMAATIILEKLPQHPEYRSALNSTQRHNLSLVTLREAPDFDFEGFVENVHIPRRFRSYPSPISSHGRICRG